MQYSETVSRFLRYRVYGDNAFVWHSLRGDGCVISHKALDLLLGNTIDIRPEGIAFINAMKQRGFLLKNGTEEDSYPSKFRPNGITFNLTKQCNFQCPYCISNSFFGGHNTKNYLTFEIIKTYIDNYYNLCKTRSEADLSIAFNGGECLLYFSEIEKTVNYCNERYGDNIFEYRINTNASLVTDEIAHFIKCNNIQVFTSLDGPRYYNDKVRIKSNGSGTYDDITAGLLTLRNSNIDFVINTVLTDKNISGINNEYIEFLISTFGIKRIGIDVDLLHLYKYEVDDVVTVLIESQEFCNKLGVRLIGMYQSPFKHLEHCGTYFCAAQTGNSLAIDSRL